MSQEAQIAEKSANSESYHLSRSVFWVATSLLSCESAGKRAALERSIFGSWLTPCDDAEHKPAQNEVCASSHNMDAIPQVPLRSFHRRARRSYARPKAHRPEYESWQRENALSMKAGQRRFGLFQFLRYDNGVAGLKAAGRCVIRMWNAVPGVEAFLIYDLASFQYDFRRSA